MKEGIYEQVINNDILTQLAKIDKDNFLIGKENLDNEEAKVILSQYIERVIRQALNYIRDNEKEDDEKLLRQIELCNQLINILAKESADNDIEKYKIDERGELLTSLYYKLNNNRAVSKAKEVRPITSISQSSLFTGSGIEPNMLSELNKEILSCDSMDLLISFVKWSGLRCIIESLRETTESGKKLRIITTSYMGATDSKAINELSKLQNTQIKISYDTERTRLHAKAYMFKRETGFITAYIGSSNLSNAALTSGFEWNIKVTERDSFDIIKKFEATFESYWNDSEFDFAFDIRPYSYQKEILEKL